MEIPRECGKTDGSESALVTPISCGPTEKAVRPSYYFVPHFHMFINPDTLRNIGRAKWFTKLDIIAAFNKIRVAEEDAHKTAFRARYGLFEYLVVPFGLTGAPAAFQRYVNSALQDYLGSLVFAYVDDILIYSSESLNDHRTKVGTVLQRLIDAGLQIDIDKCEFETKEVKYLRFIIEAEAGISVDIE